jgi:hypothetical protein
MTVTPATPAPQPVHIVRIWLNNLERYMDFVAGSFEDAIKVEQQLHRKGKSLELDTSHVEGAPHHITVRTDQVTATAVIKMPPPPAIEANVVAEPANSTSA